VEIKFLHFLTVQEVEKKYDPKKVGLLQKEDELSLRAWFLALGKSSQIRDSTTQLARYTGLSVLRVYQLERGILKPQIVLGP
jgi:hypothetical protein